MKLAIRQFYSTHLSHCREEPLWVEKPSHPKEHRSALEHPAPELFVPLLQVTEPEPERGSLPGYLDPS